MELHEQKGPWLVVAAVIKCQKLAVRWTEDVLLAFSNRGLDFGRAIDSVSDSVSQGSRRFRLETDPILKSESPFGNDDGLSGDCEEAPSSC